MGRRSFSQNLKKVKLVTMVGVMKPYVDDITKLHSNVTYLCKIKRVHPNWEGGVGSFGRLVYHVRLRDFIVGNILMAWTN